MTKKSKPIKGSNKIPELSHQDIEAEKVFIQQSQWIVDRYESANQGFMTRSSSLAGFAGVELSLVAQISVALHRSDPDNHWTKLFSDLIYPLVVATVAALLASIIYLLGAVRAIHQANLPDHDSNLELMDYIEDFDVEPAEANALKVRWPNSQILMAHSRESSYLAFLKTENEIRGKNLTYGSRWLIGSQVLLGVLVLAIFWR